MSRRFRRQLVASRNYRRNRKLVADSIGRRRSTRKRWRTKGWI